MRQTCKMEKNDGVIKQFSLNITTQVATGQPIIEKKQLQ